MKRLRCLAFLSTALSVSALLACGSGRLPAPSYEGQPTSALTQVPYPPPPARAEEIPKPPESSAVWLDGEWTWQARRWAWKKGRWVVPPADAKFSPWTVTRDRNGTLWAASGVWRDGKGAEVEEPPPKPAKSHPTNVVDPEGATVPHGPDVPLDAGNTKLKDGGGADEDLDASDRRLLADGGWLDTRPTAESQP